MGYVYESEFHVFNIIKKALNDKNILITESQKDVLEKIINTAWDIQSDHYKLGILVKHNTHYPVNSLTWWAFDGDFTNASNYIKFAGNFIDQFKLLFKCEEINDVDRENPYLNMVFRENNFKIRDFIKNRIEGKVNDDFVKEMSKLQHKHGVYFLYNGEKDIIYIGKSTNLGERIVSSIGERNAMFYEYALTESCSDAGVYEMYYISLLKPDLNVDGKHYDELTIKLRCIRDEKIYPIFESVKREVAT